MNPKNERWVKTLIFIVVAAIIFSLTHFIFGKNKEKESVKQPLKQAVVVDEIRSIKEGNLYYMYHVHDGRLVNFGNAASVMTEANRLAEKNHSNVLSVVPDPGHTFGGADVTVGVYVALVPIVDGHIVLK